MDDGHPGISPSEESVSEEETTEIPAGRYEPETFLSKWSPPRYMWRGLSILVLAGQVVFRVIKGKIHWKNTVQQLERVGPKSVGVCLLTSAVVGMAFAIQFVQEFTRLGLNRSIGGVLALALSRELSPVISVFATELGTMQVSEQTDSLRVLVANPVDYLGTHRVIATCITLLFPTLVCFTVGLASSAFLADTLWDQYKHNLGFCPKISKILGYIQCHDQVTGLCCNNIDRELCMGRHHIRRCQGRWRVDYIGSGYFIGWDFYY